MVESKKLFKIAPRCQLLQVLNVFFKLKKTYNNHAEHLENTKEVRKQEEK